MLLHLCNSCVTEIGTGCPHGKVSTTASELCQPCAAGRYNAAKVICGSCGNTSLVAVGGSCVPVSECPVAICPIGLIPCEQSCVVRSRCNATGNATGGDTITDSGWPSPASWCNGCPAGTYSQHGAASCDMCTPGRHSNASATACIACVSGRYSTSRAPVCMACGRGQYSNSTAAGCFACAAGKISPSASATCQSCFAGKYSFIKVVPDCPAGMLPCGQSCVPRPSCASTSTAYQAYGNDTDSWPSLTSRCNECPAGTYSELSAASCYFCGAGRFSTGSASVCSACESGFYRDTSGAVSCVSCAVGQHSPNTNASRCASSFRLHVLGVGLYMCNLTQ